MGRGYPDGPPLVRAAMKELSSVACRVSERVVKASLWGSVSSTHVYPLKKLRLRQQLGPFSKAEDSLLYARTDFKLRVATKIPEFGRAIPENLFVALLEVRGGRSHNFQPKMRLGCMKSA